MVSCHWWFHSHFVLLKPWHHWNDCTTCSHIMFCCFVDLFGTCVISYHSIWSCSYDNGLYFLPSCIFSDLRAEMISKFVEVSMSKRFYIYAQWSWLQVKDWVWIVPLYFILMVCLLLRIIFILLHCATLVFFCSFLQEMKKIMLQSSPIMGWAIITQN